jgi:hypothetical protein
MTLKEANFRIDFLEGNTFPGFTMGETWNGFAKPYFTFTQAQALAAAWSSTGTKAFYDDQQDAFVFEMSGAPDDMDVYTAEEINGQTLYPIGGGSWIWEQVMDDEQNILQAVIS